MFKNKKILVYGAGISGLGVTEVLLAKGATVFLYDSKECAVPLAILEKISQNGGETLWSDTAKPLLDKVDCVVVSPGVPQENIDVIYAKANNKIVISEVEIAALINLGMLVAITGTNGKTTTTTLVGELLKNLPSNIAIGGNIGQALSVQAQTLSSVDDVLVAEISSFQLENIQTFKPHIAAILNITPDHLERHKTLECYIEAKARIFENQTVEDFLIFNYEDKNLRLLADKALSKVIYFSSERELETGAFVSATGDLCLRYEGSICNFGKVADLQIFGKHNIENVLAACIIAHLAGVETNTIMATLKDFQGVEHRIEYVTEVNSVKYYNDSKATNPESTIKALEAFETDIILLAGGYDKNTDLKAMMDLAREKTKHVIFFGKARIRFAEEALKFGVANFSVVDSFEKAVLLASIIATCGDIVLLSPACSSYDRFKNYEQRGQYFKELVHNLLKK